MSTPRRASGPRGRKGRAPSGQYACRAAPTRSSVARRCPSRAVVQAAGTWKSWAIWGSTTSTPASSAPAPSRSAQAVSTAPLVQAATTSASIPSEVQARSDRRSNERASGWASGALGAGAARSGAVAPGEAVPARDGGADAASSARALRELLVGNGIRRGGTLKRRDRRTLERREGRRSHRIQRREAQEIAVS